MAKIINENKGFESISRNLIFDSSLSDRARFVYCYMSAFAKISFNSLFLGKSCNIDLKTMAIGLGCSVDTLRKCIRELVQAGWIKRGEQRRNATNQFGSVQYFIIKRK